MRITRYLAAACVSVAVLGVAGTGDAATPAEGSVSDTNRSVSWGGGPFVVANTTGTALDQPDCTAPESCDDFTLHVSTPPGYDTGHGLTVAVEWPVAAADFDLYVLDDAGRVVGTAASSADPETVVLPPTSGDYTVRVVPFAPLGQSYSATATLTDTPADPAPGTTTPPGFGIYAAPASLPDSNDAGEPSIGANWTTGSTLYQAYLSTYRVEFDDSVSPATATWTDASANLGNGCAVGSTVSLDPILFTDSRLGRTFQSQLSGANSLTCWTDDDGRTWNPSTGGGIPSGVDHQTIGGGPFSAGGIGALPTSTYDDAVYYCSQDIATAFCAVSRDGGTTFGAGVPTYSLLDCGGLHGHVKVAPDGTAYLPNKACGSTSAVAVSTDNGTSWTVHSVAGSTPGDSDPAVGVGANGTAYFGYVGADGRPAVATSHDQGATWSDLQPVGIEAGIRNAVFPAMVAGDDDRAAFAFLGTPTGGNYQDQATFDGVWHLYVATTYDGGRTWQTADATPDDPVQRGSICTGGTTCGDDRNLLDFMDVTTDASGRIEVGFADGCIDACVTDPSQNNRDAYATIARQSSGKPLFAAYDPLPDLTVSDLSVVKSGPSWKATVTIRNVGEAAATDFGTQVTDNGTVVGSTGSTTLEPGGSTTLTYTWKQTKGSRTVVASVDPLDRVAESDEANNKAVRTVGK